MRPSRSSEVYPSILQTQPTSPTPRTSRPPSSDPERPLRILLRTACKVQGAVLNYSESLQGEGEGPGSVGGLGGAWSNLLSHTELQFLPLVTELEVVVGDEGHRHRRGLWELRLFKDSITPKLPQSCWESWDFRGPTPASKDPGGGQEVGLLWPPAKHRSSEERETPGKLRSWYRNTHTGLEQ